MFEHNSTFDDEEIAAVRATIGEPLRLPPRFNTLVTPDATRQFALAFGDDNPLWCDPQYGSSSAVGTVVAPPTFPYSVFAPGIGPGFDGLQGFHAGSRWELFRPLVPGDEIDVSGKLVDLIDVEGRSGRTLIEVGLAEYRDAEGRVVATNECRMFRKPRPGSQGAMAVSARESNALTAEDREIIEAATLSYARRGGVPRWYEDTAVGEVIPDRFKGPLELNDIIAFTTGVGNVRSGELALKLRHAARTAPETVPNNRPLGWLTERVAPGQGHMDATVAKAVGMPTVYDNGWLRMCWLGQFLTDWMGDDARLKVLDAQLRLPNLAGDVLRITGRVTGKSDEFGEHLVEIELVGLRQDGATSCKGTATVALPTRGDRRVK